VHSDNDLGLFALHCDLLQRKRSCGKGTRTTQEYEYCDGKVRSWEKCVFKPSKWKGRSEEREIKKMMKNPRFKKAVANVEAGRTRRFALKEARKEWGLIKKKRRA